MYMYMYIRIYYRDDMLVSRYLDDRRTDLRKNTTIAVLSTSIRAKSTPT